jgi:hypothetical protein
MNLKPRNTRKTQKLTMRTADGFPQKATKATKGMSWSGQSRVKLRNQAVRASSLGDAAQGTDSPLASLASVEANCRIQAQALPKNSLATSSLAPPNREAAPGSVKSEIYCSNLKPCSRSVPVPPRRASKSKSTIKSKTPAAWRPLRNPLRYSALLCVKTQ